MENRILNSQYEEIGKKLINTELELSHIKDGHIRVAFLESDKTKKYGGKTVYGECEKIMDKHKWSIPYDFAIIIYKPNIKHFNNKQLEILLFHELLHIGVNEKTGKFHTVPHDLEDFKIIIDKFGTEWSQKKN